MYLVHVASASGYRAVHWLLFVARASRCCAVHWLPAYQLVVLHCAAGHVQSECCASQGWLMTDVTVLS
jgi:hypothetical protein